MISRNDSRFPDSDPLDASDPSTHSERTGDPAVPGEILRRIRTRLPDGQFETWFRHVQLESQGRDHFRVVVPNDFYRTYIRHRFLSTIEEAIEDTTLEAAPRIEFEVGGADSTSEAQSEDAPPEESTPLNENYTFDQFVTGPANSLAHAAASAVADDPGDRYNPLFIHGPVGLGKTHLMQAVARTHRQRGLRVVYVPCATFIAEFVTSLERNETETFREKYRHVDSLLIDDVQLIANKERTQEEFFHTFNELYNRGRQIFLTSDCEPHEIRGLGERLTSRFKLGFVVEMRTPTFETRTAIVLKKGHRLGMEIPQDVAEYIADHLRDNVRELEGAVLRLHSLLTIEGRSLSIETVRSSLSDLLGRRTTGLTLDAIENVVATHFSVPAAELVGKRRHRSIVVPRQIAMFLTRRLTDFSLTEIGRFYGGRDHTTVLHSVSKIESAIEDDRTLRSTIEDLERSLRT